MAHELALRTQRPDIRVARIPDTDGTGSDGAWGRGPIGSDIAWM